jgi:ketosteroid isomerase-like protein
MMSLSACSMASHPSSPTPLEHWAENPTPQIEKQEQITNAPELVVSTPAPTNPVPVSVPKPEPEKPKPVDLEAERAKLLETDNSFARRLEDKGSALAFYEYLAPDARILPIGEFPIQGRDAIRVHLAAGSEVAMIRKPAQATVAASADLGYTWGTYEVRTTGSEGQPQISYGKYLSVWKKMPDGSWRITIESDNPSPPPNERR